MPVEPSIFIYSARNHLIVRQYPNYKIKVASNSVFVFSTFLVILIIFISFAWLFKLNSKIWAIYNVTQTLIGNSLPIEIEIIAEKIFYLCLVCINIMFSVNVFDIWMQINFHQHEFVQFETLDDVLSANIKVCLPSSIAENLQSINDTNLNELLRENVDINDNCTDCSELLLKNDKRISGCCMNAIHGKAIADMFTESMDRRIISVIKEPVLPGWNAMLFAKT